MIGGYRRPANVAFVVGHDREDGDGDDGAGAGEVVYLSALPSGSLIVLRGTGALIWQQALAADNADLVDRLALSVGMAPEAIRDDVEGFVSELVEQRLLEPVPDDPEEPGGPSVSPAASS